jgi:HD-GYP domain-containing protein (c-di-GMP phosphodiesterase class II)
MTSDRPYRQAMRPETALAELRRCSGSQFDPEVVTAFCRLHEAVVHSLHPGAPVIRAVG